jgi:DNA (cytosine-5)-methyltransferase 1
VSRRPRLLDLFCGAGGASVGYHRAGFEVVGVDSSPMPRYPFEFHQADAMTYPLDGFDAVHASPPCHGHSALNVVNGIEYGTEWMLGATIDRLTESGLPFVVENVATARRHMPNAITLCGSEFGLSTQLEPYGEVWLRRHRLFESNVFLWRAGGCNCSGKWTVGVYGHGAGGSGQRVRGKGVAQASREVMGIDWMSRDELDEAIPPAYTQFVGEQLLDQITRQEIPA